jgi:hypothetical protein
MLRVETSNLILPRQGSRRSSSKELRVTTLPPPPPSIPDAITLPRAAPVPVDLTPALPDLPDVSTWAPAAFDVPTPRAARRSTELIAVAALAFGVAWFARGTLDRDEAQETASSAASEPAPREPHAILATPAPPAPSSPLEAIPRLAVSQLPLLQSPEAPTSPAHYSRRASRRASSGAGPGREALVSALGQVARSASSCGERGGPVRVVVTFNNSGVARGIHVSATDLPSATRSCIIAAASRARVPAFEGPSVSASKTL